MIKKCEWCNSDVDVCDIEIFQPFSFKNEGDIIDLCEDCLCSDFFDHCGTCGRFIWKYNGRRVNLRIIDAESVCVACLHKKWLEEGMKSFDEADFFDYEELASNGWKKYGGSYLVAGKGSILEKVFNKLKKDKFVLVNIDSCGMGLEYLTSLYIK